MPITLDGTNGITTPMYNGSITANAVTPSVNIKNRIINGAMVIDQRNAGASVTPTNGQYTLDRWQANLSQSSKYSVQQDAGAVTPPVGFNDYLGVTSLSAYSVISSDFFDIAQSIEGFNSIADLNWGTANAKTVTLSFWVRSSLTGTFGGALQNEGFNRSYPFTYTISTANTWEQKSVTIAGDTSGTWNATNGVGIRVRFGLGVGSTYSGTAGAWAGSAFASATGATSVVGTNGATWYVTGVQLEVGSTATSFDYRPYGTELALCQRYYEKSYNTTVVPTTATAFSTVILTVNNQTSGYLVGSRPFNTQKRIAPSVTIYSVTGTAGTVSDGDTNNYAVGSANQIGTSSFGLQNTSGSTYSPSANIIYFHFVASAEL